MWERTEEQEEWGLLSLGGHSFTAKQDCAITSCNRLLLFDFFSLLQVEQTDP